MNQDNSQEPKNKGGKCGVCGQNKKGHGKPCETESRHEEEVGINPQHIQLYGIEVEDSPDEEEWVDPARPDAPTLAGLEPLDNDLDFEDLPINEQRELEAIYEKTVQIHEQEKEKIGEINDSECDVCGAQVLPRNMKRHKSGKKCKASRKATNQTEVTSDSKSEDYNKKVK